MSKEKNIVRNCIDCGKIHDVKLLTQGLCIDCSMECDKRMESTEVHLDIDIDGKTLAEGLMKTLRESNEEEKCIYCNKPLEDKGELGDNRYCSHCNKHILGYGKVTNAQEVQEPIICYNSNCNARDVYSWTCKLGDKHCKDRGLVDKVLVDEEIKDNIKPNYYHKGNIDTIKFCIENKLDFLQGSIVKYVVRYKEKNGLEDLNKAMEFLKRLIEDERGEVNE